MSATRPVRSKDDVGLGVSYGLADAGRVPSRTAVLEDFPDVLAVAQLFLELRELRPERIARRHHADRLAVLDHGDVPEASFVHEVERVAQRAARVERT